MDDLIALEHRVQGLYDRTLLPLGEKFHLELPRTPKATAGLPSVLFLGNHSSGKSSFINYLVGGDLQKTGLAPTDDGFTVITYGEEQDEFDGPTVSTHPDLNLNFLERLGPNFISRLRLKTFPSELLQSMNLIDSPGMIDAAHEANSRGYDYAASVRFFAEQADLVLFFFDPDKPGTTGETVSMFTKQLRGLEHKLLIVMNKVDLFSNIRDFARTYGTLCWNLSKSINSKDVPHIFNTYLPTRVDAARESDPNAISLSDFDTHREEIIKEIRRSPTRRADNLVSDLHLNARRLDMHVRVCQAVGERLWEVKRNVIGGAVLAILVGAGVSYAFYATKLMDYAIGAGVIGLVVAALILLGGKFYLRKQCARYKKPEQLDAVFAETYREDLQRGERADLDNTWQLTRRGVRDALDFRNIYNC
ncbi:MAG: dynamin family protein [Puniceicoccales bacterium]